MKNVLVMYDDAEILAWLIDEKLGSVGDHITNGYPHLEALQISGDLKTEIASVQEELFNKTEAAADSFEVVTRKFQQKVAV